MKEISSKGMDQISGEIDSDKPEAEGLEHLEKKENAETSPEEKRSARITKYQELLAKQEAKLAEYTPEIIRDKASKAYEKALADGRDADMAERLRDAMNKTLSEEAEKIAELAGEIRVNISKLEAGQDDLYNEN